MARRGMKNSKWFEERFINGFAVFMGYLIMGVRGLGILVITWTTVVLLGGFVSVLGKKDFWCLTGITLVQTAGVFNVILEQTMTDLALSMWGLLGTAFATVTKSFGDKEGYSFSHELLAFLIGGIQALVLVIRLCPVAVLYVLGIYISAGLGLWRLIQHDFGNANVDGAANLKAALQVLYSLAVAQGVVFGYKTAHAFWAKFGLAEFVAGEIGSVDKDLVSAYLEETVAGCEKDPSFATGRNLLTCSVDLMIDAKSNDGFITGVKILGAFTSKQKILGGTVVDELDRMVLAKHLLTRPASSFSQMIRRLPETLGPRSPYSGMIRVQAARIVELVAGSIQLEEHPGWIHSISSLLETFEEYSWRPRGYKRHCRLPKDYERGWLLEDYERETFIRYDLRTESSAVDSNLILRDDYSQLVCQGFRILQKLAVDQHNCRVIINTEGLVPKIMAPLYSNQQLHRDHHDVWATIAEEPLKLMMQLAAIPGETETGTKLRAEISRSSKAIIIALERILESQEYDMDLKVSTVELFLHLSVDTSFMKAASGSSGRIYIWILLLNFLVPDEEFRRLKSWMKISSDTRRLAGEKLSSDLGLPLQQSIGFVIGDLTRALVDAGNISTSLHAARILERLCLLYTEDNDYLKELKKDMVDVMPEVLKEILNGRGSTGGAVNIDQSSSLQGTDIESGGVSGGQGVDQASSSQQQTGDEIEYIKLREALSSLCRHISFKWKDVDVIRQLNKIAEKVCLEQGKPVKTYRKLVEERWYYYICL